MASGIPVVITNLGTPVTPSNLGTPVTLVGGNASAVAEGQTIEGVLVDGVEKDVTFTVVNGVVTEITTA